jgi:uroporphyrinogen-III synthase
MSQIKSILVSQPNPNNKKSPYSDLAERYKLKVDFRSFIHVEGVDYKEFRDQKINLKDYTAVILTSRNAIDHFFRICEESRYEVPNSIKYFCISEAIALYLQKYVVYRKRKVFFGGQRITDIIDTLKKNKNEKFLLPSSDILKPRVPETLDAAGIDWTRSVLYRTVHSDLSDLENVFYDVLVFYSPAGIESLFKNFPDFKQNDTRIAVFGDTTKKAAENEGLRVDIAAPTPEAPSMTGAIANYIKEQKKAKV